MNRRLFAFAVALYGCGGWVLAQAPGDLAAKAKAALSTKDPGELLTQSLFLFYRNFGDPRLNDLGRAVWELDRKKYPDLSWNLLDEPEFRINFAQLWAQWTRRVYGDEMEVQKIRSYVEPFLSSSNPDRQAAAVNFFGAIGGESDIQALQQIALEERVGVAMNAILAIHKIGGRRADAALRTLAEQLQAPNLKKAARELKVAK